MSERDLMTNIAEKVGKMRDQHIEMMAAAYIKATNIPPEQVELVMQTSCLETRFFFRDRDDCDTISTLNAELQAMREQRHGESVIVRHLKSLGLPWPESGKGLLETITAWLPSVKPDTTESMRRTIDHINQKTAEMLADSSVAALKAENASLKSKLAAWESIREQVMAGSLRYLQDGGEQPTLAAYHVLAETNQQQSEEIAALKVKLAAHEQGVLLSIERQPIMNATGEYVGSRMMTTRFFAEDPYAGDGIVVAN